MRQVRRKNPDLHIQVKVALLRIGYNQARFCAESGIDKGLMSKICNGSRYPSHDTFQKIVDMSQGKLNMKHWDLDYDKSN